MVEKVKNTNSECYVGLEFDVIAPVYKRYCDLGFIPDSYKIGNPVPYAYLVNKETTLPEALSDILTISPVRGMFPYLLEKNMNLEIPFDCGTSKRSLLKPLTIWDCLDQFFVFVFGCAIATVSVGIEWRVYKHKHN